MTLDKIIVTLVSVLGMVFVYRFFLIKKGKEVLVSGSVDIVVEGGYTPEIISIPKGKTTRLNFIRKDDNNCLEDVVLGDFKIRKHLPLHQSVAVEIHPQKSGKFIYSCGMGMYHGKIIVR